MKLWETLWIEWMFAFLFPTHWLPSATQLHKQWPNEWSWRLMWISASQLIPHWSLINTLLHSHRSIPDLHQSFNCSPDSLTFVNLEEMNMDTSVFHPHIYSLISIIHPQNTYPPDFLFVFFLSLFYRALSSGQDNSCPSGTSLYIAKVLRWRGYPGLSWGRQCNHKVLIRGR